MSQKKSILCAVLNQGEIETKLSDSLHYMKNSPDYDVEVEYFNEQPISHNRNMIVQKFLAKGYDYLLMIDSDIVAPPSVINMADYQKDVIAALCFMYRDGIPAPVVFERKSEGMYSPILLDDKEGIIEVDAVGTGCIMLSRRVLEVVKAPFLNEYDADGIRVFGLDIAFSRRAKEKGFKIFANLDYVCDHWKRLNVRTYYATLYGALEENRKLKEQINKDKGYVEMDGHSFSMPEDADEGMKSVMQNFGNIERTWEPITSAIVKNRVKEGQIAVDIGASIGYFTNLLARQVGEKGKVIAFEPTPNQFPYLKKNIEINGYSDRTTLLEMAAWDKKEKVKMPPIDKKFECQAITADEVFEDLGILDKINFIKIDVDGSEPQVLRGLIKTFESNPELEMMFEYYPAYIEKCGGSAKEVKNLIEKYFTIKVIEELGSSNMDKHWNWHCIRK